MFGKFVKGDVIQTDLPQDSTTDAAPGVNPEAMALDDDDEEEVEGEKEIEVAEKDVPEAVFGGLKRKSDVDSGKASTSKKTRR